MDAGMILLILSVIGAVIYRVRRKTEKALKEIETSY